jgi:O-acetyl-ADP-ribose deacetylase (regulator of RNase III)
MSADSRNVGACTLELQQGDITTVAADAIVNAANSSLLGGGGVDGAIHRTGGPAILEECRQIVARIGRLPAGRAVLTTGGRLPARHVIHTVGPVWQGGGAREPDILASCYTESLDLARRQGLGHVAFPSISTGVYGYPVERAAPTALTSVRDYLARHQAPARVTFVLYDQHTYQVYARALRELESGGRPTASPNT